VLSTIAPKLIEGRFGVIFVVSIHVVDAPPNKESMQASSPLLLCAPRICVSSTVGWVLELLPFLSKMSP
jgi:hypothetical protein